MAQTYHVKPHRVETFKFSKDPTKGIVSLGPGLKLDFVIIRGDTSKIASIGFILAKLSMVPGTDGV